MGRVNLSRKKINVYLSTSVFAVIQIYSSKMVLQALIQTYFNVLLTKNSKMFILNDFGSVALFLDFLQNQKYKKDL